jgi:hypothetical protein
MEIRGIMKQRHREDKYMKRKRVLLAAVVAAFSALPSIGQAKSVDEVKIEALAAAFTAAVNAKDVDAIMKVYVPDESLVVFDIIPPRQYIGANAFRTDWENFVALFKGPVKFEVSDLHVELQPLDPACQRDRREGPTDRFNLAGYRCLPQNWRQLVDCP